MAKKYLLCDNEIIAKQKSRDAINRRWPNREAEQLALHNQNPTKYPHPSQLTKYLHGWAKDKDTGICELEIPDTDTQYYPDDLNELRNTRAIVVAKGPK